MPQSTETSTAPQPVTAPAPAVTAPASHALDASKTATKATIALVAIVAVGFLYSEATFFPALVYAGIWASAALGLSLLIGWAGQISLGQAGVVAVGSYGAGLASAELQAPFLVAAVIGVAAAVAVALITSPVLRIRGFYFVLVTLALGTIVYQLLVAATSVTGGANGLLGIGQLTLFGYTAEGTRTFFFIAWVLALIGAVLLDRMVSGRYGRALKMLKESPDLAAGVGVPVPRAKAVAWIVSACYAGIAGVIFTYYSGFIAPENFQIHQSVYVLAAVMLAAGGRSPWGAMIGTVVVLAGPQILQFSSEATQLATAIILILVTVASSTTLLRPLSDGWRRARDRMDALAGRRLSGADPEARGTAVLDGVDELDDPRALLGRSIRAADRAPLDGDGTLPALELTGVEKSFGGLEVLRSIDLCVGSGTIQGLIGPNGAGKTSLLSCIIGSLSLDHGTVSLFGTSLAGRLPDEVARLGLVRTFQHPRLIDEEPVLVNVMMGAYLAGKAGLMGPVVTPRRVRREEDRLRVLAMQALCDLGCEDLAGVRAADLTAGQRRLAATAQALAAAPRVLMLDEPAAGLNDVEMAALAKSLVAVRDEGMTIIVIEHHLEFVANACDTVAALVDGRIVINAPAEDVMRHPEVVRAYLGTAA